MSRRKVRVFDCEARFSADPDLDPEPIYRCTRPEGHEPPHEWSENPYWLSQRAPQLPPRIRCFTWQYATPYTEQETTNG